MKSVWMETYINICELMKFSNMSSLIDDTVNKWERTQVGHTIETAVDCV